MTDNWLKKYVVVEKQGEQKYTVEEVLTKAGLKPYKDGDQWCILLGDNIQEGICGFGDTIEDALCEFLKDLIANQGKQKPFDYENATIQQTDFSAEYNEDNELSCFESALFTAFSDAWQSYLLGEKVNVKQWAKEHSKELLEAAKEELKEQKPAWSEEDESIALGVEQLCNCASLLNIAPDKIDKIRTWLKSLKERMKGE